MIICDRRHGTAGWVVAVLLVLSTFPVMAQSDTTPLEIGEVIRRILEEDPSIQTARRRMEQAFHQYELTRAGTRPDLALNLRPYSFDRRRVTTGTGAAIAETHAVAAGVELLQPLPTSGRVSVGINHRFSTTETDGDRTVQQVPEVTFSLAQPIFFNGGVVDTGVFRAGLRNAEIAYERAGLAAAAERAAGIRNALALFVDVASLRRSIALLEETIDLLQRQLDTAELDREQGLLSDNAVLALQVTLNDRRATLFDSQLGLVRAEQELARLLGDESLNARPLGDAREVLEIASAAVEADVQPEGVSDGVTAIAENPAVRSERLGVEQTRRQGVLNEITDRPQLAFDVTASPLYPTVRTDAADVGSSFGDYFDDDADVAASLGVSVRIPLLTRRERQARESIDTLEETNARVRMEDTELATTNRLRTLLLSREFLQERRELLDTDIRYQERRVQNERDLLAAGASTQLRVAEVELDLQSRENERWQVTAELFLNAVDVLSVRGTDIPAVLLSAD
ncbi:MAG: TolC family protein [Spirochaeta sp.]|jgi:outer membrane protein TolC|nr:TolC family protein [Spirochaeta sp.]